MTPGKLKVPGMILFLLGLLTGLSIMLFKNPRMGLAAHLKAILNGIFLVVAGIIWDEIKISASLKMFCLVSLLYGTYANWLFTLLSAIWGTSKMTPLSGSGYSGSNIQESIISAGLITVALTMIFSLVVIIYGLREKIAKCSR